MPIMPVDITKTADMLIKSSNLACFEKIAITIPIKYVKEIITDVEAIIKYF